MIDFETLGNGTSKCVCQIGAVYFNNSTGELGDTFKVNVNAATHVRAGAKIDADTVYWWIQQSNEARASIVSGDLMDVTEAFLKLNEFLKGAKRIWSHATFDFVTLTDTMKQLGIKSNFSYKAGLDIRTLMYLAGTSAKIIERTGVHHDALADCVHQVKYCVGAMNTIRTHKKLIDMIARLSS